MGDRGNIVIVQHSGTDAGGSGEIYLYTHWGGSEVARVVQCGLRAAPDRWDDEPYLGRIIFNELTAGAEKEVLSFGVSTYLTDNEHDLVVVDTATRTVSIKPESAPPTHSYPFHEFAQLDLVAAHLVGEASACLDRSAASAGDGSLPSSSAPPGVGGHLPYVLAGLVLGAALVATVRARWG